VNAHGAELALAMAAARSAGDVVMPYFGRDLIVTMKDADQPLTEADLAANRVLHEALIGARPEYGWLSEETRDSAERLQRERVWIVDPIDGTRSFIAKHPEFTISIGLVESGVPIVGVVYNPARDEMYFASTGDGAFIERAGVRSVLRVSERLVGAEVTMLASRSEIARGEFEPFHGTWAIEPAGSTAYKLARVAEGAGDAFVSRGPKSEWDIAGGVLIVTEAGGIVTDVKGAAPRFNNADPYVHGMIASNAKVHGELLRHVGELPAAGRLRRE